MYDEHKLTCDYFICYLIKILKNKGNFKVYEIMIIEYFVYFCLLWFEVYKLTSILYFKLTIAVLLIAEECTDFTGI